MAVVRLNTVAGNTAPPLELTAKRDGVVIDLTNCTVDLIITQGTTVLNTGHQSCTITGAVAGEVSYVRQAGDMPLAGTYVCDLKVTYSDLTFEILYDVLKVKARKPSGT